MSSDAETSNLICSRSRPVALLVISAECPGRFSRYASMLPSRDHTPTTSSSLLKVKRVFPAPLVLSSHTSTLFSARSLTSTATRLPSGESVGLQITAGFPTSPNSLPAQSIQVSTDRVAPVLVLYTSVPFSEAVRDAQ